MLAGLVLSAGLGHWQSQRADGLQAALAERAAVLAAGPAEFDPRQDGDPGTGAFVRVTGVFDTRRTIFIDNRTHDGIAGFHVLAPLRLANGGATVMVLRGWVAADPASHSHLPEVPAGSRAWTVDGLVEARLPAGITLGSWRPGGAADRIWPRYRAGEYEEWSGLHVLPWVLRQTSDSGDGLVREWPGPGRRADAYRAVALMWYSVAVALLVTMLGYGVRVRRTVRRKGADGRGDPARDRPSGAGEP